MPGTGGGAPCPSTCQRRAESDKGAASRELLLQGSQEGFHSAIYAEEGGDLRGNVTCLRSHRE